MAQANPSGGGGLARFSMRFIAMIVGLVGVALALVILLLYTVFSVLGTVAGIPNDSVHFLWGVLLILLGVVGSLLAPILPIVAAVCLIVAGVGFFFVVGWWALIASPVLLIAGLLTFSNKRVNLPATD